MRRLAIRCCSIRIFDLISGRPSVSLTSSPRTQYFAYTTDFFFEGFLTPFGAAQQVLWWVGFILVEWAFLYFLYKKKVFLRI